MRTLRILSAVALTVGALSFAATTYVETSWNWNPVQLPMPGPGRAVDDRFEVANGGRFEIGARVPREGSEREADWPDYVPCELRLSLEGPHGFRFDKDIRRLRHAGGAGVELYVSEPLEIPRRGAYEIKLHNIGSDQVFGDRGAMVSLERYEHPTEAYMRGVLLRFVGWAALAIGVLGFIASEAITRFDTH